MNEGEARIERWDLQRLAFPDNWINNTNMHKIQLVIGLTGRAGSGKDYFSKALIEAFADHGLRAKSYALAQPLKEVASELLEVSPERWDNRTFKVENRRYLTTIADYTKSVAGETIFGDLLVRKLNAEVGVDIVIVTDIRYNYEVDTIKSSYKTSIIGIKPCDIMQDKNKETIAHSSEFGIDEKYVNLTVVNNYTDEFDKQAKYIADNLMAFTL